ncbi:MAG: hypothetical protein WCC06_07570 [Candidatus Aminicenantales bacterium]
MKKSDKKSNFLSGLAAASLVFFFLSSSAIGQKGQVASPAVEKKFCFILIDYDSLFCSPCLDLFLRFCNAIPVSVQESAVRGVVVYSDQSQQENSDIRERIMSKKIEGFIRANHIKFPVVVDHSHVFSPLKGGGTTAFLFDLERKVVNKYGFPLKPKELEEILSRLLK